jgi:hypothetical protein
MKSSEKIYLYRDFAAVLYLSEAHSPSHEPIPLPLTHCTVYVYKVYLFTNSGRRVGGKINQREYLRGNISQSWLENTHRTDFISSL